MDFKDFIKGIWSGIAFNFTLTSIAMVVYTRFFGINIVPVNGVIALFIMSLLLYLAGIVLCANRGLKRGELFVRHAIRLLLIIGIVLSTATYMGWLNWANPATVILFAIFIVVIYSVAMAVEFYETKKLTDKMTEKINERNRG